jgi:RNA polymerase sigma-70 factor, ECF subfamily
LNEATLQLVDAARGGDRAAFGELVVVFKGKVYGTALALTGDAVEAQELTQETFVRAMQGLPRLQSSEKFGGWMRGITCTLARDVRRKAARERRHLQAAARQRDGQAEAVDVRVAGKETSAQHVAILKGLVGGLPENVRVALDLRFREGLSYAQIGEVMGVPASTVRGLLYRGTKALRDKMRPMLRSEKETAGKKA